jgi:hypothetical protein
MTHVEARHQTLTRCTFMIMVLFVFSEEKDDYKISVLKVQFACVLTHVSVFSIKSKLLNQPVTLWEEYVLKCKYCIF